MTQPASMKSLGRSRPTVQEVFAIIDNIAKQEDREIVLIGAALLDDTLLEALKANFIKLSARESKSLDDDVLSTFSAKIHVARAIGVISRKLYNDLERIRHLRNAFAHWSQRIDFSNLDVSKRCLALQTPVAGIDDELEAGLKRRIPGLTVVCADEAHELGDDLVVLDVEGRVAYTLPPELPPSSGPDPKDRFLRAVKLIWYVLSAEAVPRQSTS